MNKPTKPQEPNKSFDYQCYSCFNFRYEKNDAINKKYPFLYLSDVLNNLPENWQSQALLADHIKLDFSEPRSIDIFVPIDLDHVREYEKELKQYKLDLQKYELEMAKYELHLAEEKLKNLEKFYAKT